MLEEIGRFKMITDGIDEGLEVELESLKKNGQTRINDKTIIMLWDRLSELINSHNELINIVNKLQSREVGSRADDLLQKLSPKGD